MPSYFVSVLLILLCVAIPSGAYHSVRDCLHDLIPTLTFTQPLFRDLLIGTKLNGVLWTAAIEMQFYLFFPLLAWAFTKKPGWTYLGMLAVSIAYLWGFALQSPETIRATVNQLPAFFGVFANGMAFAFLFVWLSRTIKRSAQLSLLSLVGLIVGFWMLCQRLQAAPSGIPFRFGRRRSLSPLAEFRADYDPPRPDVLRVRWQFFQRGEALLAGKIPTKSTSGTNGLGHAEGRAHTLLSGEKPPT